VLGDRLQLLQQAGLVRRATLPPPAASAVDELTDRGHQLKPVLLALAGWGYLLGSPRDQDALLATRADTGEVLHARMRTGRANTARGAKRFMEELAGRLRRAGASGQVTLRADSGFWSAKVLQACRRHGIRFSVTVRQTPQVRAAIARSRGRLGR
jgi:Transposase DDE domain group 1/HxlR-like helix-turn-helix